MTGPRGTPLDLRAVRERTGMLKAVADGNPVVAATVADLEGLDTHCRALRAALDDALTGLHNLSLCFNVGDHQDVGLYKHPFCNY